MPTVKLLNKDALPIVTIDAVAMAKVQQYVLQCTVELGWMGLVEQYETSYGTKVLKLCEPYAPAQEVSNVTCDLDPEGEGSFAEWAMNLAMSGETRPVKWWGHSHVNMSTRPSNVDIDTFEEHVENDPDGLFVMTVHNKAGDVHCNLYLGGGIYAEDVPVHVDYGLPDLTKLVQEELANNLREKPKDVKPKKANGYNSGTKTGKGPLPHSGSRSDRQQLSQSDIKKRNAKSNAMGLRQGGKSQHPKPSVRGKAAGAK